MFIKVSISYQQLSRIISLTTFLFLMPFCVADLVFIYSDSSLCFQEGYTNVLIDPFSYVLLGEWLKKDGFIKLGILTVGLFFFRMRMQIGHAKLFLPAYSNFLMFFWLFNIAWSILGGTIYWQKVHQILCTNQINSYIPALLIINYIVSPIGLVLSRLRPTFQQQQSSGNEQQIRRDTEMVAKVDI